MLTTYELEGLLHEYLQFSEVTKFSPKVELHSHSGVVSEFEILAYRFQLSPTLLMIMSA